MAAAMLLGVFTACQPSEEETSSSETTSTDGTEGTTAKGDTTQGENSSDETESKVDGSSETVSDTSSETDSENDSETEPVGYAEGHFGPTITVSNQIKNGVQTYFSDENRTNYVVNNLNMSLQASVKRKDGEFFGVNWLKNKNGGAYLHDTMDVFVRMKDGKTYYASNSTQKVHSNVYRLGYYYYDAHIIGQDFLSGFDVNNVIDVPIEKLNRPGNGVGTWKSKGDYIQWETTAGSSFFWMAYFTSDKDVYQFSADEYNTVQFSFKSDHCTTATVWYVAGSQTAHNTAQRVSIELIPDGKYHTYTVLLARGAEYKGNVKGLRFDFSGGKSGDVQYIKDIKLGKADISAPVLTLDRVFHTYPDKLHQALHFTAAMDTEDIDALGMITDIDADTVDKLIVKADGKLYESLDEVKDWSTAEYVGFDIKDVGIFGYILANDEASGTIKVTLKDGKYTILQEATPENGTIFAPSKYTENDYYMGQRLYTDESHSFKKFISEAEFERDPAIGITTSTTYYGYNAINGAFEFSISGAGFNPPYYYEWNRHHTSDINVKTKNEDRQIYIRTKGTSGCLEGAAILDQDGMLLPIPLEVSKNFEGEDEEPVVDFGDKQYGETIFPLYALKNTLYSFTVVNAYQNWGQYPLKQISSIQYFAPYYHLSTGVTESSCIAPWYNDQGRNLWTLPDFRAMSSPLWAGQPQHTHGGIQYFLQYTDADGIYNASENYSNVIGASGLSYSEVLMSYISDDGKIKVDYNHIEFPQTDEMRAFYEMSYEVLEDVKIADFKRDFSFYTCKAYGGTYTKLGYLDKDNNSASADINADTEPVYYQLGDKSPYAAFYGIKLNNTNDGWVNVGIVLHSADITIGGEKYDGNFTIMSKNSQCSLTLDLEAVTLKKGDKITINMIIVPWGVPESESDINMQNLRQNSSINSLEVEVTKGEKIESVFVPRIKTDDGKSAEFTLSGGANNVAVRVYGFDKLTSPKIFEKIDGQWVPYVVNTADTPDPNKNYNYYDGYYVFYDEDGTYSYSFVTNMTETAEDGTVTHLGERTFKVVADEDFVPWPVDDDKYADPLDLYITATQLYIMTSNGTANGMSKGEISQDGSYVSFYGDGGNVSEVVATVFSQGKSSDMIETGRYIVLKYRIPVTNQAVNNFSFYIATTKGGADGQGDAVPAIVTPRDGKWKIVVFDLVALKNNSNRLSAYVPDRDDGKYYARFIRFDIFNTPMGVDDYVDIGFVGMTNDLQQIIDLGLADNNISKHKLQFIERTNSSGCIIGTLDAVTGIIDSDPSDDIEEEEETTTTPPITETFEGVASEYVDASSGYLASTVPYCAIIDYVNGKGENGSTTAFPNYAASSEYKDQGYLKVIEYNGSTTGSKGTLYISGWNLALGGVQKYVWSADGGKTWHDVKLYNKAGYGNATGAAVTYAKGVLGRDLTVYVEGASFQSSNQNSGICAHLGELYAGQTVNVTFAAIPNIAPDTLCLITHIKGVKVPAAE